MTLKDKILSETTYQNIQFFPAVFLLGFSFILMMINYFIILFSFFGYGVYLMALKFLKMTYTEKLKNYRYLYAIIYDIDYHKVVSGYIVFDINETFAITVSDRDKIILEKEYLEKELAKVIELRKAHEQDMKLVKDVLKKLEKKKDKDKSDKEKKEEIDSKLKENELELKLNEVKAHIKRLNKKVLEYMALIERANKILDSVNPLLDSELLKNYKFDSDISKWKIYKTKVVSSSFYEKDSELFFVLPTSLDETFIFTQDDAYYDDISLEVPNYSIATFIESTAYKSIVLICIMCSYFVNEKELTLIGKDKAEKLLIDAKITYLSTMISDIQNDYEMLQHDNMHLENQNEAILDQMEKMAKRDIERIEVMNKEKQFSFDTPPREKYALMYLLAGLTITFAIAFFITLANLLNVLSTIN